MNHPPNRPQSTHGTKHQHQYQQQQQPDHHHHYDHHGRKSGHYHQSSPPPPPDRSPVESRMAVTDARYNQPHMMDPHSHHSQQQQQHHQHQQQQQQQQHHRHAPQHHGYPQHPADWPPPHHQSHFLPPPDHRGGSRSEQHLEPQYHHHQQQYHHAHPPPHHSRPTASPEQRRGHAKSASRDNFLPPPLPPTLGPPSDRGSPSSAYDPIHYAKARSAHHGRQLTPPHDGMRYENGPADWGHKRKRSDGHDQYAHADRSPWGPYPSQPHPHPHGNGVHYHPDAPPSWGQQQHPGYYDADFGRMQPPASKKVSGHDRHRSIDDPRARKTTQPPPSPGNRNGVMHPMGSPYDQPPRLPRAATEEVRHHPQQLIAGPLPPRVTPPEMRDAAMHYQGGPMHMAGPPPPHPAHHHAAASQPPPSRVKDESAKQRSAEAKRQKEAAKQREHELAMQREHELQQREAHQREMQQREQQQQLQYEAEAKRAAAAAAAAAAMPPSRARATPPPLPPPQHQQAMAHYESGPPLPTPAGPGYPPHALHQQPHMEFREPPMPHQHHHLSAKEAYFEQSQRALRDGSVAAHGQPVGYQQVPVTRTRIISDPVWQWFDEIASGDEAHDDNVRVGTWLYAPHKQPLLPGDLLASNVGGLVEVRISGRELGAYRETSDARAQLGWTLGWRARHQGVRVDVADKPLSAESAAKVLADAEVRLALTNRKLWGSEVYTDDSDVLAMCIHSGWIEYPSTASGEARKEHDDIQMYNPPDVKVTLRIAPRLVDYKESFGGGLWSRNWYGRHDGVSLIVENVELQQGGDYAGRLPGHRGTKQGVKISAKLQAKRAALSQLDELMQQDGNNNGKDPKDAEIAPLTALLDSRKQSVFPLSAVRRGGEEQTGGKGNGPVKAATCAPASSSLFWWNSQDILANLTIFQKA